MVMRTTIRDWRIGRLALVVAVLGVACAVALFPGATSAAEPAEVTFEVADRSLGLDTDWQTAFWASIAGVVALFALGAVGYLYRRERGLDWEFQKPDAPHDAHH